MDIVYCMIPCAYVCFWVSVQWLMWILYTNWYLWINWGEML